MNELIRQLAKQSGFGQERWNTTEELENFLERFGQAVARECSSICTERAFYHMDHGRSENAGAAGTCGNLIRQRFGVE